MWPRTKAQAPCRDGRKQAADAPPTMVDRSVIGVEMRRSKGRMMMICLEWERTMESVTMQKRAQQRLAVV